MKTMMAAFVGVALAATSAFASPPYSQHAQCGNGCCPGVPTGAVVAWPNAVAWDGNNNGNTQPCFTTLTVRNGVASATVGYASSPTDLFRGLAATCWQISDWSYTGALGCVSGAQPQINVWYWTPASISVQPLSLSTTIGTPVSGYINIANPNPSSHGVQPLAWSTPSVDPRLTLSSRSGTVNPGSSAQVMVTMAAQPAGVYTIPITINGTSAETGLAIPSAAVNVTTTVSGCPSGLTLCGAVCVNTSSDANNCNGCGNVCASCSGGVCCSSVRSQSGFPEAVGVGSCSGRCVPTAAASGYNVCSTDCDCGNASAGLFCWAGPFDCMPVQLASNTLTGSQVISSFNTYVALTNSLTPFLFFSTVSPRLVNISLPYSFTFNNPNNQFVMVVSVELLVDGVVVATDTYSSPNSSRLFSAPVSLASGSHTLSYQVEIYPQFGPPFVVQFSPGTITATLARN